MRWIVNRLLLSVGGHPTTGGIKKRGGSAKAFSEQRTEDHVEDPLLAGFIFIQNRQATPQRKTPVEIVGITAGQDDDPVFVQPLGCGIRVNLGAVDSRHLQIDQEQVQIGVDGGQALDRVAVAMDDQAGEMFLNIIP